MARCLVNEILRRARRAGVGCHLLELLRQLAQVLREAPGLLFRLRPKLILSLAGEIEHLMLGR
jgi:hypothetical protein